MRRHLSISWLISIGRYVVVVVDGRGTGGKGRKLRNVVKGDLGKWETFDQVEAARIWASKPYVDPERIGIWGWVSSALPFLNDASH